MRTMLTERMNLKHPIVLAPMGSVAGGSLAAAVTRAGGLGLIGAGYGNSEWLERELDKCTGTSPFGVGFITWSLARNSSALDLAIDRSPDAVMFSFGDHRPYVKRVRDARVMIICQVQTVRDALYAVDAGADVIVAQGTEAGGHGRDRSLFSLLPAVVDAVSPLPVLAAGGIVDGRGLAAALVLGASGGLVGTRFMATSESLLPRIAKQRLVRATGDDTRRTRVPDIVRGYDWPPEYTGRALSNRFIEFWHGRESTLHLNLSGQRALYKTAVAENDFDHAVIFAGEGLDGVNSIEPVARVMQRMVDEAETCLASTSCLRA
ncbi:NAD(P)H-dependent flavin oxidoreductase [Spiribacter halobius]|uniref:2-nitropropane dioxygenase n=1 Tax=Sediminicurvatus halobius TaxID=2182432 RepID=A0A2U2MWY9_9GAMM|nr:nitronate monooxygenase [Spiribacter halobius]PWG61378.1 2-nitropropane dioxygenase [Spiribacter halobius]UEX76591.1 nitronate monooxygenase [Spiribacter halobius]